MRRVWTGLIFAAAALTGCTKVEPGYAGIKVNNYGTQRGVKDFPVRTGRVWFNPFTQDVYKFPTFQQNYIWSNKGTDGADHSFTVNSVEGATVNFDVGFSLEFQADSVPHIFVAFRKDADHIVNTYVRSLLRDAFSRHASRMKVTDIFGQGKQVLQDSVTLDVADEVKPYGIHISQISMIGEMRVDPKVQASINAVLTAAQKAIEAENKVKQSIAEAQQQVAEAQGDSASAVIRATGTAEANRRLQQSLTAELIDYQKVLKWNGQLPQVSGSTGSFVDLRGMK